MLFQLFNCGVASIWHGMTVGTLLSFKKSLMPLVCILSLICYFTIIVKKTFLLCMLSPRSLGAYIEYARRPGEGGHLNVCRLVARGRGVAAALCMQAPDQTFFGLKSKIYYIILGKRSQMEFSKVFLRGGVIALLAHRHRGLAKCVLSACKGGGGKKSPKICVRT